jgi:hypothetical protein
LAYYIIDNQQDIIADNEIFLPLQEAIPALNTSVSERSRDIQFYAVLLELKIQVSSGRVLEF